MTETATKETARPFKLSEYIKDGYLAKAIRNELKGLNAKELPLAQDAIRETAEGGIAGTFDELLLEYRRSIRRALHPERKLVKDPKIDRKVIKNPTLAARLDRELDDVTADELARANTAVREIIEQARAVQVLNKENSEEPGPGDERFVMHAPTDICPLGKEHSTIPGGDKAGCGYFRSPEAWEEVLREAVRAAILG
jgi:hypothetical protein